VKSKKIQRRGYFRLKCLLDTDFLTLDPTQLEKEILDEEFHKCVTKNISGSGICLSTEEYIDEGQIVKLSVTLDEDTFIQPTSQIVRIESIDLGKDKVFNFGCEFIKIKEAERNLIIRFVYEQQRRLLKKDIK
jgi:c-di-GMP-binding flagellar brake protein YcgR